MIVALFARPENLNNKLMTSVHKVLVLLWATLLSGAEQVLYKDWNISALNLPNPTRGAAVGAFNNTIWIIGGDNTDRTQSVSFDLNANISGFTSHDPINCQSYGGGQFWTQSGEFIYFAPNPAVEDGDIVRFDMSAGAIDANYSLNAPFSSLGAQACIASSNAFLLVIRASALGIYEFETEVTEHWTSIASSRMFTLRQTSACAVNAAGSALFVIGGASLDNADEVLDTVEWYIPAVAHARPLQIVAHRFNLTAEHVAG